jgi:3-hydroxyacyl-CoA dehydrogenase
MVGGKNQTSSTTTTPAASTSRWPGPNSPHRSCVKQVDDPGQKVKMVVAAVTRGPSFAWKSIRDTLIYAVNRIPEIADDIVNVDNAMRWGFNWEIGPFEMLDAIGVAEPSSSGPRKGRRQGSGVPQVELPSIATSSGRQGVLRPARKGEYRAGPGLSRRDRLEILKKAGGWWKRTPTAPSSTSATASSASSSTRR